MTSSAGVSRSEAEFFDQHIGDKGDFNPFADRGWDTLRKRFEEMALASARGKVDLLDVGCGTGQSRRIYAGHTKRYVGIDLSSRAIEVASASHPDAEWKVADAAATPFDAGSFDVVAFSSVLHHIPDFTRVLVEARRVLRPGGVVFAFDPNLRHPAMFMFRHPKSPFYLAEGVSPNECPLLPGQLKRAFAAAGLVDIRQRCQADIPYRAVAPKLINALLSVYNAGDRVMEKLGIGRLVGSFVITSARAPG